MARVARYDGYADWYDSVLRGGGLSETDRHLLSRLLGEGPGRCLDTGCGTGAAFPVLSELGWSVTGVDVSQDQLRLARERGGEVLLAPAERLPFGDATFDAAVSLWTHTDVDDFPAMLSEIARVVRRGAPFVYVGAHPCFVGPHSRFTAAEGVPELHPGYRQTDRYTDGPGVRPDGLRAKVGATHLTLAGLVDAFLDVGFTLESFEEDAQGEYPHTLAMRWRR